MVGLWAVQRPLALGADLVVLDVTVLDKTALALLSAVLLIVGVYPRVLSTMIEAGMTPIVKALGG